MEDEKEETEGKHARHLALQASGSSLGSFATFQHDIDSDRGTCSGPDETVNIIIISFVGERISCEGGQVAPPGQIYEHRGRHMAIVIVLVVTFNLRR